jgi:hypothetical protein
MAPLSSENPYEALAGMSNRDPKPKPAPKPAASTKVKSASKAQSTNGTKATTAIKNGFSKVQDKRAVLGAGLVTTPQATKVSASHKNYSVSID